MAFIDPDQSTFIDPDEEDVAPRGTSKKVNSMEAPTWAKVAAGAPEAAVAMLSGLPSQITGGLYGLGTLLSGQGLDKSANASKRVQENNFGFGSYKGTTEAGKKSTEVISEAMYKPVEWAGQGAEALGLDPIYGALPTEVALNLLPLPLPHAILKGSAKATNAIKDKINSAQNADKPAATIPETIPEPATPVDPGNIAMRNIAEQQLKDWVEPLPQEPRSAMPDIAAQLEQARYVKAQQEIAARQAALEAEVAQRAGLERNAAERARQESAPTGYAEWVEALRMKANELIPGNNEALPFESPYPVDASNYPNVLKEAPYQYEGGIDPTGYIADQTSLPVAVRDMLGDSRAPDPFNRYSPNQAARRILEEGEHPPIIKQGMSKGQRGAIDLKEVQDGVRRLLAGEENSRGLLERFNGTFYGDEIRQALDETLDPKSRERIVWLAPDEFHKYALSRDGTSTIQREGRQLAIREAIHAKDGLSTMPQLFVNKGVVWGHEGRHRMDIFKELGVDLVPVRLRDSHIRNEDGTLSSKYESLLSQNGEVLPVPREFNDFNAPQTQRITRQSERGMLNFGAFSDEVKALATLTKDSPQVITAQKRTKVEQILGNIDGYRANVTTPEQVIALAPKAKDITKLQKFNTNWRPGLRINTINTNNPLLKFANHVIHNAWTQADNLARVWITDNKTGIGPKWRELKNNEKIEVHELLKAGDRKQRRFTTDELRANNFSENQIAFIQQFYEMDDLKYQIWNEKRMENGEQPIRYREGHFPGNFKGDYKTLVFDKDGQIIGYIGTDTKLGHNKALAAVKEKFPDATFSRMTRNRLGGHGNRSDLFTGMSDLIAVLAKNDPRLAEIHQAVQQALIRRADGTFGADLHALDKKGIWGNEGNKPWSADKLGDANEAMKAFFEYWEEGMISHHMMPAEAQLTALMQNPELSHMPRAASYLNDYVQNITGRSVGEIGQALNTLIDAPMKLLGLGPSVTRQGVNQFTKRMGQWTQGFANIPYTVMQFTQYAQTGVPLFTKVAGGDMIKVGYAVERAGADAITLMKEKLLDIDSADPTHRMMFDYAESKGMFQFSEFEEVSHIAQGDFARNFDKLVDYNRSIGEKSTRPWTFFTFVRLLEDTGMPKAELLDTAYNLTQDAMVDYSSRERAPMFKNLGVVGQTAGNLQQFSLTYLDQMGRWVKDAGKGNPGPLVAGTTIMLAMAGLQGAPFYNTIDDLVELMTDKFFGEKKNISTLVMQSPYEWAKSDWLQYGALSTLTGLNMTSRMGMADVAPESFADALSPYASTVGRMATTAYDAYQNPDDVSFATAARQWAPSSVRGLIENKYLTDDTNVTVNAKGQKDYPRTEFDKAARAWSMTSLEESKAKDKLFTKQKSLTADTDAVTKIGERVSRRTRLSNDYTQAKLDADIAEYTARGGDPKQLVNKIIRDYEEAAKTSKMRIEGTTLKNMQQLRRWMKINEE